MNVDKFGHHLYKTKKFKNNLMTVECALKRLSDNNLDAKNAIIRNLKLPVFDTDSVNKAYVDKSIEDLYNKIDRKHGVDKELLYKSLDKCLNTIQLMEQKLNESNNKINSLEKKFNNKFKK